MKQGARLHTFCRGEMLMSPVSKSAYEKFKSAFETAPNTLTVILRSHHAIEAELHSSLGLYLALSPRLELRKIPFLTKVDLLISLQSLNPIFYPFFAEVNLLRNRFAHNPDAELLEEDKVKIKNLFSSCTVDLSPRDWELTTPGRALGALLQTVYLGVRVCYEEGVKQRVQSRALDQYIAEEHPSLVNPENPQVQRKIDIRTAEIAKNILAAEYPEIDSQHTHAPKEKGLPQTKAGEEINDTK
jgi:hypothetical protein